MPAAAGTHSTASTVHPRFGSLGDFTALLHEAGERGIRVAVDLQDLVLEPDEGLILRLSEGREDRS